jgi:uncharacterized protein (DUF305 family)
MNEQTTKEVKNNAAFHLVLGGLAGFILALGVTGYHQQHGAFDKKEGYQKHMYQKEEAQKETPESLSMSGMTDALKGKTGDEFDKAFLTLMIEHHQGAVDMANEVLKSAKHQELKTLAQAIIVAQTKEITQMKEWQAAWGYQASPMGMDGSRGMMMHE